MRQKVELNDRMSHDMRMVSIAPNIRPVLKADVHAEAWARPYANPDIIDVYTGLGKGFKYSPIFKKCIAETMVKLTGYREKDYVIAELQTGKKHTPKVSVWHHAWDEKKGLYRMQLVDFSVHKKTCPHAGGCKLWLLNNQKGKNAMYRANGRLKGNVDCYLDVPHFYSIESNERNYFQKGYVSKKTLSLVKRKGICLVGVDMYGNLIYQNDKSTYFWDHEQDILILIKKKEEFYIKNVRLSK